MKWNSISTAVFVVVALSACKEVQLNGPVGGADVSLSTLRNTNAVSWADSSTSKSDVIRERGQEEWDKGSQEARAIWLGNTSVDTSSAYGSELYLLTAKYGRDMDSDANKEIDSFGTSVAGEWHSIMDLTQLDSQALKVSLMTEAAYQYVKPYITNSSNLQIKVKLDEFARKVVNDVVKDGVVNYWDVLSWSRFFDDGSWYKGDTRWLDQLASGIRQGVDEDEMARLAQQVYENRYISATPQTKPEPETAPVFEMIEFSGRALLKDFSYRDPCDVAPPFFDRGEIVEESYANFVGSVKVDWKLGFVEQFTATLTFDNGEVEVHDMFGRDSDATSVQNRNEYTRRRVDGVEIQSGELGTPVKSVEASNYYREPDGSIDYGPDPIWTMVLVLERQDAPVLFISENRIAQCADGSSVSNGRSNLRSVQITLRQGQ